MKPLVHIIILNWNSWRDTAECVESCRALCYPRFRIVVVDNGSTDDSEKMLRHHCVDIDFVQTGSNLGFAGGNNVGIRRALEQGAEYIWLLNNDTVVHPDALSTLVAAAEADPAVGLVGSKILYHGSPDVLWYAGAALEPSRPHRPHHLGLLQKDTGSFDEPCETGYVTGCSLLARRRVVEDVGLLDDRLFLYFEDVDWSARAKASGWKALYCPLSRVWHKVSLSTGSDSPLMMYYTARNRLYFVKRNFPGKLPHALLYDLYEHVLVNLKKGRVPAARYALQGIGDFLSGRTGSYQVHHRKGGSR